MNKILTGFVLSALLLAALCFAPLQQADAYRIRHIDLQAPADNVTLNQASIMLSWSSVPATSRYLVYVSDVQIQALTTHLNFTLVLPNSNYTWFVLAISKGGRLLGQSDTWQFNINDTSPQPVVVITPPFVPAPDPLPIIENTTVIYNDTAPTPDPVPVVENNTTTVPVPVQDPPTTTTTNTTVITNETVPAVPTFALYDNFENADYCLTKDGTTSPDHKWKAGYLGYGSACVQFDSTNASNKVFATTPKLDSTLRAIRIDSTQTWLNPHAKFTVRLDSQSGYNTQSWYTFWALIGYADETNHYYFNLKTNGWELGKKDNNLDPSLELQRYLAAGNSPKVTIGSKAIIEYWINLTHSPKNGIECNHIVLNINGAKVVDLYDDGTHYDGMGAVNPTGDKLKGAKHLSLYNEASLVSWDSIYIEETQ